MNYTNEIIENLFQKFQPIIGKDFQLYRNHVYRVFLNCLLIDPDSANEPKYAIASVFHDIGIWTDNTFDYLAPSIEQAKQYLTEINKEAWIEEISSMVYWHHKISSYKGINEITVESFRKADWIDVSFGLKTFEADKTKIRQNIKTIPPLGFHFFLVNQTFRHFLKKPLKPLPMFKK